MRRLTVTLSACWSLLLIAVCFNMDLARVARAAEPKQGTAKQVDLGGGVSLEVVYIPPGEFLMGSTPEEKSWATGIAKHQLFRLAGWFSNLLGCPTTMTSLFRLSHFRPSFIQPTGE